MRFTFLLAAALVSAGCTMIRQPSSMVPQPTNDWRSVVTASDRARLRDWRSSFVSAVQSARAGGHSAEVAAEGALLEPDSALGGGAIPDGDYRCRILKLGAKSEGMLDFVTYPAFRCRVDTRPGPAGERRHFTKLTGSQRVMGVMFPDGAMHDILLGTMVLGDEQRALQYGVDETRDVAGMIERIGPARWRLVMPQPHFESRLDVMELVPA